MNFSISKVDFVCTITHIDLLILTNILLGINRDALAPLSIDTLISCLNLCKMQIVHRTLGLCHGLIVIDLIRNIFV